MLRSSRNSSKRTAEVSSGFELDICRGGSGHHLTLNAIVRRADDDRSDTRDRTSMSSAVAAANLPVSGDDARGNVILNAAARKAIAQDAQCTLGDAHPAAAPAEAHGSLNTNTARVICTA